MDSQFCQVWLLVSSGCHLGSTYGRRWLKYLAAAHDKSYSGADAGWYAVFQSTIAVRRHSARWVEYTIHVGCTVLYCRSYIAYKTYYTVCIGPHSTTYVLRYRSIRWPLGVRSTWTSWPNFCEFGGTWRGAQAFDGGGRAPPCPPWLRACIYPVLSLAHD